MNTAWTMVWQHLLGREDGTGGAGVVATLWLLKLIRPNPKPSVEKLMPYECGITPESDSRGRYTVRFYLVAILFVIFDVETIFLFPWAVQYQVLGLFGLVEMLVFLGILIVGYIWIWKRGALECIQLGGRLSSSPRPLLHRLRELAPAFPPEPCLRLR